MFQLELHLVCGKAELATDRAGEARSPRNKTLKKGRGGWTSPSRSSMRSIQLISVVDAVGRVHLGHRPSCEMSWEIKGCVGSKAAGRESAADDVQLVSGAAEAVMSGLCILVLIMVMRQIHRIYCSDVGDL